MPAKRARKPAAARRAPRGTGTVFYSDRKGRWIGRVQVGRKPNGKPLYRELWGKTQREVVDRMRAAEPPGPGETVAGWVARWWATVSVRPSTRKNYRDRLDNYVLPQIGHLRLTEVGADHVEAMTAKLLTSLEATTVGGVLAVARAVFGAAVRAGVIPRNPVAVARRPRQTRKKVETYTPGELLAVIGAADRYSAGGILATMAGTGCRVGEAMALDVPDFDPKAGTLRITKTVIPGRGMGPPKSANGVRTIGVPALLRPVLVAAAGGRKAGPLFLTGAGRRFVHQLVERGLAQTLAALGLPKRKGHVFRHSVATQLIAAQVPIGDVAVYLGDSVTTIVKTYLHPTGVDPTGALDRLLQGGRKVGESAEPVVA